MDLTTMVERLLTELLGTVTEGARARTQIASVLLGWVGAPKSAVVSASDYWLVLGPLPQDGTFPHHPLLVRAVDRDLSPDVFSTSRLEKRLATLQLGVTTSLDTRPLGYCIWHISQFGRLQLYVRRETGWRLFAVERADWPEVVFHREGLRGQKHNFGTLLLGALLTNAP